MKNGKTFKLIALMLALVMCLSLCACGGGEQDDDYAGLGGLDVGGAQGGSGNGGSGNGGSIDTGFNTDTSYLDNIPKSLQGTTVTFAAWGDENATEYAKVMKLFTKKTKINVKWVTYTESKYISTIVEQNAAGKGPDIVIMNLSFPTALEAVQELPKQFDINDGFWDPRVAKAYSVKGKNYFINSYNTPFANGGAFVFYNKQLFANNNIKSPQDYVDEGKWSWENFDKAARELKDKGYDGGTLFPQYIWSSTGSVLIDYDPATGKFSSGYEKASSKQDILASLKMVATLRKDGVLSNNPVARLSTGQVGMAVVGDFGMKYNGWFKNITPSALGVVNLPTTLNGKKSNIISSASRAYGIGKDAKNVEGAYYALRFYLDLNNYNEAGASIFVNKNMERFYKETFLPTYRKAEMKTDYMEKPLDMVGSKWSTVEFADWKTVVGPYTPEEVEINMAARANIIVNAANTATNKVQSIIK